MLAESLAALAAAGGAAIVQAAGTDTWAALRQGTARLIGREDAERQRAELVRLDQTAADVLAADQEGPQRVRWESVWQARLEVLLESLAEDERQQAVQELQELVGLASQVPASGPAQATGAGGLAAGGNVSVRADRGSLAGGVVRVDGGVHLASPFPEGQP